MTRFPFLVFVLASLWFVPVARAVDFDKDVEPIFRTRCSGCHGAQMQTNGVRFDDGEAALKGGYSGPIIIPGNSAKSTLIDRVTGVNGVKIMPPGGKKLTPEQVVILRKWIDEGAHWPKRAAAPPARRKSSHWSFQPIQRPQVPAGEDAIDHFIQARLTKEGFQPSPEADRRTLLRRLSLDLTGLLPTTAEMEAFLADKSPNAYEKQVDRLLTSPHYGEKWARQWLDQARYADSDGYEKDWVRPFAWRYREWVINAINRDMPFDQFTIRQIAGDLLPDATVEDQVATGFHRNTLTNREGGVDNQQFRFEATVDRAATVGTVWLGLTVGCAQCHDHKYDPISQKDFYQLYAFFDNVEETDIDAPMPGELGPFLKTHADYEKKRQALLEEYHVPELQSAWEKRILEAADHPGKWTDWDLAWDCVLKLTERGDGAKILRKDPAQRTKREQDVLTDHFVRNYHFAVGRKAYQEAKLDECDKKLRALYEEYPQLTQAYTISAGETRHPSYLRVRGDYKTNGVEVKPETPAVLPPMPGEGPYTRLDLANWLVSKDNPLTARVIANRVWQELFGTGIVRTSDDFGTQGEAPSHPELLDWLASEFRDNGWSLKHLQKTIVMSATYRQCSQLRPELTQKDPGNRLLARQSRMRLPAELIRDAALEASGLLDLRVGGPSIRPPQPKGVAELGYANSIKWKDSEGADAYRRGLYIHFQRTTPYPLLANFDAPKGTVTQCRRERSNTPLQALNLLNDPVFLEAAQALAVRTVTAESGFDKRLAYVFERTLGRSPRTQEAERLHAYYDQQKTILDAEPKSVAALVPYAPPGVDRLDLASWTGLSTILLNLDEFITRE